MKKLMLLISILAGLFSVNIAFSCGSKQLESNKQTVIKFYNAAINQKDFNTAAKFLGAQYIQHNPTVSDGKEGFKQFIDFLKTNYPQAHSDIKQVFADGDFVILHVLSKRTPDTRGRAIFDLFKLKNGKIIEHWDTVQDIPSNPANNNTMF